ncbi:LPS-assembly protein LptD [Pseudoxanthomonas sacheonensis]|uniref:LPS-assembly protein LptD n=1 Tax=Pseudoxanthomonas sacheonensis TaxID=443615 RepID=UPI0013D1F7F3|nr:LPS-assembly protein LptD [Pseudoxanthomonas sacheonensis]KAF1706551.1 LPS-assembly protein LptD [Pseudoxanthomonas sacheonensis]
MRPALRLLPLPFSIALCLPALAEDKPDNWDLCPIIDAIPAFDQAEAPKPGTTAAEAREQRATQPTAIEGDRQTGTDVNMAYEGNVVLRRGDQFLNADNLKYDQETDTYVADGNVRYQDSTMRVIAARAHGDQNTDTHEIEDVQYQLVSRRGNGGAESIDLTGAKGRLNGSTYSTCDPQQRVWELRSNRIDVDTDEGWGVARDATIRIGKVPVLYVPWIKFPIDDRRHTGLLYPAVGMSGRNGFDYRQPIYLNLAPNYDATIIPRYMSDRGVSLGGQFRYLYEGGRGTFDLNWMPTDDLVKDRERDYANGTEVDIYGDPLRSKNRGMFRYSGSHNLNSEWQARADLAWVSDSRYVEDFANSLYGVSATSLVSTLGLYGRGRYWTAGAMADVWQLSDYTLTEGSLPYNRLPRVYFNWEQPFGRWFTAGIDAEAVRFQHNQVLDANGLNTTPGGSRLDLKPFVSMPLQGASWYITPTLAWRYTSYKLDEEFSADPRFTDTSPSRSLPIASLDAGLFFDRDTEIKGERYLHTLEPRLFYLNAPYRDQDGIPIFDTRPFTFSWGQLFRDNRYTGPDRQTDANQLTLALTSRLLRQADGHEKLSASLGQIFYFDESRVTAPGELPVESGKSAWVADLNYAPTDRWTIGASYQWNPKFRREDLASLRARYLLPDDGVVNLGYRYRRNVSNGADLLEQADFSFLYPITPTWSVVGRYYYSILDKKPLEALAGVQWDSCCLAVRAVVRRYVRNREGDLNNAFQVEFVLKGLGSAGQNTERTLRRAILGYYRDDLYLVPPSNTTPDPDDNDSGPE